ncbi:MAG TPA: anti-sigma factor [Pyrinomonadaceae bacterium]|nr:anti-sigma factor [Pyrinomonadaceae bacterium]
MNCREALKQMHAFFDGELELARTLEVERHMNECRECARALRSQTALRSALRDAAPYYRAPASLRKRVRSSLRDEARAEAPARPASWRWLAVGASLAAVLLLAAALWTLTRGGFGGGRDDQIAQEVVSAHVRSLMANHLTDVASTDQHTVKPWFDGRIDFAPQVKDLAAEGFPLVGGRLDYLNNRAVAALVYQRNKHLINLFVWPAAGRGEGERLLTRQGYNAIFWTGDQMNYCAVSDLNAAELQQFASLIREPAQPAAPNR